MPSTLRLVVIAVAAVTLAACGPDADLVGADSPPSSPVAIAGTTGVATAPPSTPRSRQPVDSPPTDAPTDIATPTVTGSVPSACGLVHESDLIALVRGEVTLSFPTDPVQENSVNVMTGATSHCFWQFESHWTDEFGVTITSAVLTVQVQSTGVEGFVPPQPGVGTVVDGIGDGAVLRNAKLYVRLGDGMLTVEVGIPNPAKDRTARSVAWTEQLATIIVARIRG